MLKTRQFVGNTIVPTGAWSKSSTVSYWIKQHYWKHFSFYLSPNYPATRTITGYRYWNISHFLLGNTIFKKVHFPLPAMSGKPCKCLLHTESLEQWRDTRDLHRPLSSETMPKEKKAPTGPRWICQGCPTHPLVTSWWLKQPIWKLYSSNFHHFPQGFGENEKIVK